MSELNAWWIPMEPYQKDGKSIKSNPADDDSFLLGSYIDLPTLRSNKACDDTNKRTMTQPVTNRTEFKYMATIETNFDRNISHHDTRGTTFRRDTEYHDTRGPALNRGTEHHGTRGRTFVEIWHIMTQGDQP
ncbi:hypothetical protein DPMN_050339 [Dreissena polymorpha]|uniref:Uncharacterized protein n=1 Tax=Dreissena polymorpha TaxID=45954 RepID=A0A9D4CHN1_DREPO|nr:hypothetical protein DPMN_050339 [Dreissena polymorpha]